MSEFIQLRKSLSKYIDKYPPPSREQNTEWLKQISESKNSNSTVYYKTREKMILSNGGFAMKYVMRYKSLLTDDVSVMDLFQEANLGIIEAIDTFQLELGTSFTTYAHFHIKKRLIDFIKKGKLVKAPRDIARNLKNINEIRSILLTELTREPIAKEIAERLKKDKNIVLTETMIDNIVILLDLNSASTEETFIKEFNEQNTFEEEETNELFKLMEGAIETKIKTLPETLKRSIRLRFGIGCDSPHSIEEVNYMLNLHEKDQKVIMLMPESDRHFFI